MCTAPVPCSVGDVVGQFTPCTDFAIEKGMLEDGSRSSSGALESGRSRPPPPASCKPRADRLGEPVRRRRCTPVAIDCSAVRRSRSSGLKGDCQRWQECVHGVVVQMIVLTSLACEGRGRSGPQDHSSSEPVPHVDARAETCMLVLHLGLGKRRAGHGCTSRPASTPCRQSPAQKIRKKVSSNLRLISPERHGEIGIIPTARRLQAAETPYSAGPRIFARVLAAGAADG